MWTVGYLIAIAGLCTMAHADSCTSHADCAKHQDCKGGTCADVCDPTKISYHSGTCVCPPLFRESGTECEAITNPCDSNPCKIPKKECEWDLEEGRDTGDDESSVCVCPKGWSGDDCTEAAPVCLDDEQLTCGGQACRAENHVCVATIQPMPRGPYCGTRKLCQQFAYSQAEFAQMKQNCPSRGPCNICRMFDLDCSKV